MGTAGLVYDILIHERQLPMAIQLVDQHPNQMFVLDHLAKRRLPPGKSPHGAKISATGLIALM